MKNKCEGCGIKIQTTNPQKPGYINRDIYFKNHDNFLCERCFNLKHYNQYKEVIIDENIFYENVKKISSTGSLIVYVIDGFDLEGTFIDNIRELFPHNKIMVVVNKFDLFLSSTKPGKIRNYISGLFEEKNVKVSSILLASAKKEKDIINICKEIMRLRNNNDVYLFGMTNVGKSTLINEMTKLFSDERKGSDITVSNMPSTTLDMIKISLPDKSYLYDMPGIINKHQITYYLNKDTLNKVLPKKFVKPKTFQLNPLQTLFVGNFVYFNYLEGEKASFVTNFSNDIVIHRTKMSNASNFFELHKDDILLIPTEEERNCLGKMISTKLQIDGKKDIAISGLGFLTVHGKAVVEVVTYESIKVSLRESLI